MAITNRKANGFTLMEMLVALIMATVVLGPLYVVTRSLTGQAKLEQVETEAMQRARVGLHTLLTDLAMTGLHASPNPFDDPRSFSFGGSAGGSFRHAVVHLNPNDDIVTDGTDDSIVLVGNFFGDGAYSAVYQGGGVFSTQGQLTGDADLITAEECNVSGFLVSGGYHSYAHIEKTDGRFADARVTDATFTDGVCTVTVAAADIPPNSVSPGDVVYLSSNQAALYRVENTTFDDGFVRRDLVRYFVDYEGDAAGECTVGATGAIQPVEATRRVIAEYVAAFQVWFRPVRTAGTARIPNFYPVSDMVTADAPIAPGNDELHVLLQAHNTDPDDDDLSCQANSPIEAQHIRSAVVLLSIHSEKPDLALDDTAFGTTPSRAVRLAVKNCTTGPCALAPAAYKLKTVVTETDMPNLAARSDIPLGQ